jgi:ATP-binding cassette subfamily C (CFTR/MRP) protein 4
LSIFLDCFSSGIVEFNDVSLSYGGCSNTILKNISFKTGKNEKIGIVGRTGAGKSSLITALFRLSEPTGNILIDNINITDMGLNHLRKSISIIPQGKNVSNLSTLLLEINVKLIDLYL